AGRDRDVGGGVPGATQHRGAQAPGGEPAVGLPVAGGRRLELVDGAVAGPDAVRAGVAAPVCVLRPGADPTGVVAAWPVRARHAFAGGVGRADHRQPWGARAGPLRAGGGRERAGNTTGAPAR